MGLELYSPDDDSAAVLTGALTPEGIDAVALRLALRDRHAITIAGGHGVGRTMHGDPHVPNDGRPGRGLKLKPGLVIAIEPWFLKTTDEIYTDADGWTLRSADGSRGAHMEHTVAITADGPLVLTDRSGLEGEQS